MRAVAVSLLVLSLAPFSAQAEEAAPAKPLALAAPVDQCIRDNAAKVEKAVADLNQGVDFLVNNLCAEPVAAEQARQTKATMDKQAVRWQEACDKEKATPGGASGGMGAMCSSFQMGMLSGASEEDEGPYFAGFHPPSAVALAARLLLDLRLSHVKVAK